MKNKDKYDLRELSIDRYRDDTGRYIIEIFDGDKKIFKSRAYSIYIPIDDFINWLEKNYKESIKLSDDEKVILRSIPKEFKWICRDEGNKGLYVYTEKPNRDNICKLWYVKEPEYARPLELFKHLFQFIKWEDEEPYNIEELLKDENS